MCTGNRECMKPRDKIVKPGCCTDEQIKKCHGEVKGHPCIEKGKPKEEKKEKA